MFLGEVPPERVDDVTQALTAVPPPGAFTLRLTGGGRFGAAVWVGVDGGLETLTTLQAGVRSALTAGGFPGDERPFRPHMTVSYHADDAVRSVLAGYAGASWPVTEFALMESRQGRYERLAAWPVSR